MNRLLTMTRTFLAGVAGHEVAARRPEPGAPLYKQRNEQRLYSSLGYTRSRLPCLSVVVPVLLLPSCSKNRTQAGLRTRRREANPGYHADLLYTPSRRSLGAPGAHNAVAA